MQDVESYPPGGFLTDGQGADTFGTGSYGYDQSQVGDEVGNSSECTVQTDVL